MPLRPLGPPRHLGGPPLPGRPAQLPGQAPGSRAARPGSARASERHALDRRPWNDGGPDGAVKIRMERWESAMGRWHYYWPQAAQTARQAADPALWAAQWRGAADAQLRRLAGPQNRI